MGRNVKPRLSYENDALYLGRLSQAVELDDSTSVEWKKEVVAALNLVRSKFLSHVSKKLRINAS